MGCECGVWVRLGHDWWVGSVGVFVGMILGLWVCLGARFAVFECGSGLCLGHNSWVGSISVAGVYLCCCCLFVFCRMINYEYM